jgi:hypothetical protein
MSKPQHSVVRAKVRYSRRPVVDVDEHRRQQDEPLNDLLMVVDPDAEDVAEGDRRHRKYAAVGRLGVVISMSVRGERRITRMADVPSARCYSSGTRRQRALV